MRGLLIATTRSASPTVAALLAGCGGSQLPIGAPGAMSQTSALAMRTERGKSWALALSDRRYE
jgi:hypothetical protein